MNLEDRNYYMDRRTWNHNTSPYQQFDENRMCLVVKIVTEVDGCDVEEFHDLPVLFRPCEECNGRGKVVNPAIDANGLTASDFADDPDFHEDYVAGVFDVPCGYCRGTRICPEVDEEKLTKDQKEIYEVYLEQQRELYQEAVNEARALAMGY